MTSTESAAWLADRTAELEQARAKLASLEVQLQQADEVLAKTNGEIEIWQAARDRRDHVLHLIDKCKVSVSTCAENVRVASEGLVRAEREEWVAALMAQRATRRAETSKLSVLALDAYEALAGHLRELDALQASDKPDADSLRSLGERPTALTVANLVWLESMSRNPGKVPCALIQNSLGYRPDIHRTATSGSLVACIEPLFEMQAHRADWIPSMRASLGDTEIVVSKPQHLAPAPLPAQPEDIRTGYREYVYKARRATGNSFTEIRYEVEDWILKGPNGGTQERRLRFMSLAPRNVEVESDTVVTLARGLPARLIESKRGELYLAPIEKPSVVERLLGAVSNFTA